MHNANPTFPCLLALLTISLGAQIILGRHDTAAAQQTSLEELEARLQTQYAALQEQFANGPAKQVFPPDWHQRLRRWQDELAHSFAQAGATVEEILKLHPPQEEMWRERRDMFSLYSQPISPPESRTVFGRGEVQKRARLLESPAAAYPDEALSAKAKGEVRLRLVLAAEGTVKYVFPMKPLPHGLTEAAMDAALQIKFEPAMRNGQAVSQFATVVYEFKKGRGLPPYSPDSEFYF